MKYCIEKWVRYDEKFIKNISEKVHKYFSDNNIDGKFKFDITYYYLRIFIIIGCNESEKINLTLNDAINLNKIINAERVTMSIVKDVNDGNRIQLAFNQMTIKE